MRRSVIRSTMFVVASVIAANTAAAAPAPGTPFTPFNDGVFGCNINITAKNESDKAVVVDLRNSRSKIKMGLWNTWNNYSDWTVNKGGNQESKVVELSMSCNAGDRTYEFKMSSGGNEKVIKHPANGDFTGATTIALGNVGRHF